MEEKPWGDFCEIFGVNPRNRILEHFLTCRVLEFSIGDVAEETELNRATTYNVMEELVKDKFIIPTRKLSGIQLYKLNKEKYEVKILLKAFSLVLKKILDEYTEKEKVYA
ncbi:MAG: hypothetical protein AABW58_03275 [Nanoarchaeota archaeon]